MTTHVLRWLVWGGVLFAGRFVLAAGIDLESISIDEAQRRMGAGELTSVELTQACLARIEAIDRAGPTLRSIIEVNPDALAIAAACDAERAVGRALGPLHGIPVLIKDNIATADRMETTAGSLALVGARPARDAGLVVQLRAAGAVILGKTNLSEWANFRGEHSVSGWSARGGQTRNPHALDRSPSGSSSGSAAAVAAGLCLVAVGTETDGSIVSPASHCGIVGVKPTVGLVSRAGIIPISISQDTAGPMARTVRDAALLLAAMSGPDPADAACAGRPADLTRDFAAALTPGALRGARLGIMRDAATFPPRTSRVLDDVLAALRAAGAEIVDPVEAPAMEKISAAEWEILCYEFKDGINAWFASLGPDARVKSLADLIAFNTAQADRELRFFDQEILVASQAKGPLTDAAYLEAVTQARRLSRDEGIDAILAKHRLDAIVMLTAGPAWLIDPVNGDHFLGETSTLAAVAGYPNVTVPAGADFGLPIGVSFVGGAWTEARLLALAADFEARARVRRTPRFAATVDTAAP
ncbi:MAG: amidase [Opitutaceae bacterium]|nr:amidase [Opitutaceae bacterium]